MQFERKKGAKVDCSHNDIPYKEKQNSKRLRYLEALKKLVSFKRKSI